MATNDLEHFLKTIPGREDTLIDVDSTIGPNGDLKKLEGIDAVIKRLTQLFLISKKSYFMDPDLGTGLYKYIFELVDVHTKTSIEQHIAMTLTRYMNMQYVSIDFEILFFKNKKGFRINFFIEYKGKSKATTVDIDETLLKTLD